MGTAPKEYQPGGGGAGAGGKVRKKPYRNTQATPYDRPLTALRNPTDSVKNPNGWLSRLVDPASKLISTSARKLISSVFSKRIPPFSASKKSASDGVLQSTNKHQETGSMVHPMVEKYAKDVANGFPKFDIDGVAEFEQMVKQKRFTRDETERLTTLLRSRTVNGSIRGEEASEGNPAIKISNQQLLEEHTHTPQQVFDEGMTNPSELAKAYMRSTTSKLSSLVSDSRGLTPSSWTPNIALGTKSLFVSSHLDSGLLSLSSQSQTIASNSGHGRYSRTHQPSSLKGSELRKIAFGEPSSSSVYELSVGQHRASGFGEMSRKRRNSVLQDQFGSIGPIRRVRQKLNLLNSKTIDAPACGSSSPTSGSSVQSEALVDAPTLSVDPAPTQLTKAAQQPAPPLDSMVSSQNEAASDQVMGGAMRKSPRTSAPESPARQFFRNLEKGEPSGATEYAQCDNTMDSTRDTSLRDADYSVMEYGKGSENEQETPESFSARNNSDTKVLKNTPVADKATVFEEKSSMVEPLQKKQGFRMSVLEDFIDVDDDDAEGTHIEIVSGALNEERHPLISSTGTPVVSTDATRIEKSSPFFPSGSSGLETSDGPVISEKSISLRGSVATSSLSNQSAIPNGVSKLSPPPMFESLPIVDSTSSGLKPHAPSDSKLEASRIGSGLADDKTSKSSEGDGVNSSPVASHEFLKPQVETIATAPVLESSTIFSFGNATSNKGSLFSGSSSSGSPLSSTVPHSNFMSDTNQNNLHATHSASVGSSIGLLSSSAGSLATLPILNFDSHAESSTPEVTSNPSSVSTASEAKISSGYGSELAGVKESTVRSERAPMTSLSPSMIGSGGTANNISASSLNSMIPSTQFFASGTPTATQFTSSSSTAASSLFGSMASTAGFSTGVASTAGLSTGVASTAGLSTGAATAASSLFSPIASTAGLFVGASSSAAVATSIASSTASTSAPNANFVFGASPATAGGTGFAFGANSTPGLATTTTTNTGSAFGISLTPASATTSSGISFGPSSASTTSTAGFTFGAPSTSGISSSGLSFGASTPATISSGQPFGALSTPATTNSGLPFGTSSAPATGSISSGFHLGASSATGTTTATAFFTGSSSAPTSSSSSAFSFGASSTLTGAAAPALLFGASSASTPVTSTAGAGLPYGTSSSHAGGAFPFGASSSAASSSSSGFSFGSSCASNQFSFGAASTPAANTGSPFGFMSGTSTSPFHSGAANNTSSSQLVFGNSNPFAANNNGMEDSMAEDSVQAPPPSFPAFGQTTTNTSPGFSFNAATPAGTSSPFQFASQPNHSNPSPFQASSSLGGFSAGGSFSLGSGGGGDKLNRRIIKPKKGRRK